MTSGALPFDQSFCRRTLERVIWKRDFRKVPKADQSAFREALLDKALHSVAGSFAAPDQPLVSFPLRNRTVFRLIRVADELVVRKLRLNLKRCSDSSLEGRSQIVSNLRLLLEEGVPYRVYRLDIRSFFESFDRQHVLQSIDRLRTLSPQSKALINGLLDRHAELGGTGVPRGLALSAVLSELLMCDFDQKVRWAADTFFYARYVDDIIVVTSAREDSPVFVKEITSWLPPGLTLNEHKKQIVDTGGKLEKSPATTPPAMLQFDYLGYGFDVRNPTKKSAGDSKTGDLFRTVIVDIATKKVKRIKARIIRSLLDFSKTNDWELLKDRVAFLTQNFSVYNPKAGGKKIAGIYYSYPLASSESPSLAELDAFLRNSILAKKGRVFEKTSPLLTGQRRRQLLGYSFARGHSARSFVYFSSTRISQIQRCWLR